jgi:hypothetical protein
MHNNIAEVSKAELRYIRQHAPRGMFKMVQQRTGRSRSQVDYQLRKDPRKQDLTIIDAAREILSVATGLSYEKFLSARGGQRDHP